MAAPHSRATTSRSRQELARTFPACVKSRIEFRCLLQLPAGYDPRSTTRWPLIFFLHGAGERGTRVSNLAKHGPPRIARERPEFPFVVVSPQCPSGEWWRHESLLALLDRVTRELSVDARRIYLTGMSMGGFGAWSLVAEAPERFAAVAPVCGGGSTIGLLLASHRKLPALKRLPVWAFHGARDDVVEVEESQRMIRALRALGNEPKLTIYGEAGHDSWTETYHNPQLYDWFLSHKIKHRRRP